MNDKPNATAVATISAGTPAKVSVINALASRLECDPANLVPILKKTAFATCNTNEEFQVMCMVANTYNLNPLLKEIYAFPNKKNGAVVPIVSVDGWNKIMNSHPQFDGIEFEEGDGYCTAVVYRKDRNHPTKVTEWLDECKGNTEPWNRWPKRMLRHKALIQGARTAFGFAGIYDEDEGRRIREAEGAVSPAPYAEKPQTNKDSLKAALSNAAGSQKTAESAPTRAPGAADDKVIAPTGETPRNGENRAPGEMSVEDVI